MMKFLNFHNKISSLKQRHGRTRTWSLFWSGFKSVPKKSGTKFSGTKVHFLEPEYLYHFEPIPKIQNNFVFQFVLFVLVPTEPLFLVQNFFSLFDLKMMSHYVEKPKTLKILSRDRDRWTWTLVSADMLVRLHSRTRTRTSQILKSRT